MKDFGSFGARVHRLQADDCRAHHDHRGRRVGIRGAWQARRAAVQGVAKEQWDSRDVVTGDLRRSGCCYFPNGSVRSLAKVGGGQVDYGVHLPLISLTGQQHWSLRSLLDYTEIAERLGFRAISANDHLIFPRPWLDGPTALATILVRTGQMALATMVALPIVRGPVALAKSLAAIPFEERWKRLEEAVLAMRALWLRKGSPTPGDDSQNTYTPQARILTDS